MPTKWENALNCCKKSDVKFLHRFFYPFFVKRSVPFHSLKKYAVIFFYFHYTIGEVTSE